VVIPTVVFFVLDTVFLKVLGSTMAGAVLLAGLTSAACGWWLYRRHNKAVAAQQDVAEHKPPVGSWANPSTSQRWMGKWTASERYRHSRTGHRRR
jgi:hypothetical protein